MKFEIRLFMFQDSTIRLFVHPLSSFSVSHGAGSSESAPVGIYFLFIFVHPVEYFRVLILRGFVLPISDSWAFRASVGLFVCFCSWFAHVFSDKKTGQNRTWSVDFAQFFFRFRWMRKAAPNSMAARKP